jgi:tRNA-specific 2-thiouridylase
VDGEAITLRFSTPQRAVSPGQSAVVFSGDVVLGGGRIA